MKRLMKVYSINQIEVRDGKICCCLNGFIQFIIPKEMIEKVIK